MERISEQKKTLLLWSRQVIVLQALFLQVGFVLACLRATAMVFLYFKLCSSKKRYYLFVLCCNNRAFSVMTHCPNHCPVSANCMCCMSAVKARAPVFLDKLVFFCGKLSQPESDCQTFPVCQTVCDTYTIGSAVELLSTDGETQLQRRKYRTKKNPLYLCVHDSSTLPPQMCTNQYQKKVRGSPTAVLGRGGCPHVLLMMSLRSFCCPCRIKGEIVTLRETNSFFFSRFFCSVSFSLSNNRRLHPPSHPSPPHPFSDLSKSRESSGGGEEEEKESKAYFPAGRISPTERGCERSSTRSRLVELNKK